MTAEEKKGKKKQKALPALPKHPDCAAGAERHKEAEPNCLSKLFSERKIEVNSTKAVVF